MNAWIAYALGCAAGAYGFQFVQWARRQREERKAPLFVTWRDALTWAYEHPGQLARSADGAKVRAGGQQ